MTKYHISVKATFLEFVPLDATSESPLRRCRSCSPHWSPPEIEKGKRGGGASDSTAAETEDVVLNSSEDTEDCKGQPQVLYKKHRSNLYRKINKEISSAYCTQSLLNIIDRSLGDMNAVNLSTSIHRLARAIGSHEWDPEVSRVLDRLLDAIEHQAVSELERGASKFSPRCATIIAWSCATLQAMRGCQGEALQWETHVWVIGNPFATLLNSRPYRLRFGGVGLWKKMQLPLEHVRFLQLFVLFAGVSLAAILGAHDDQLAKFAVLPSLRGDEPSLGCGSTEQAAPWRILVGSMWRISTCSRPLARGLQLIASLFSGWSPLRSPPPPPSSSSFSFLSYLLLGLPAEHLRSPEPVLMREVQELITASTSFFRDCDSLGQVTPTFSRLWAPGIALF